MFLDHSFPSQAAVFTDFVHIQPKRKEGGANYRRQLLLGGDETKTCPASDLTEQDFTAQMPTDTLSGSKAEAG